MDKEINTLNQMLTEEPSLGGELIWFANRLRYMKKIGFGTITATIHEGKLQEIDYTVKERQSRGK